VTFVPTALLLGLLLSAPVFGANLRWHWEDPFTAEEQARLRHWITNTQQALERLTAPVPFPVHLYMHRLEGRGEPVPWANTRRGKVQGIKFYVDPAWPLEAFLRDWTAAHEMSHLLLPYLGERHSWFAEGFASYLQYRVLAELGALGHGEVGEAYREHVETAAASYADHGFGKRSFIEASLLLRSRRAHPVYYWGGAVYFMTVDKLLHASSAPPLVTLLAEYIGCCRERNDDFAELLATLDRLSGTALFTGRFETFQKQQGFPAHEDALRWIETNNFLNSTRRSGNLTRSRKSKNPPSLQEQ